MKKLYLLSFLFLAACAAEPVATPNAGEIALQMLQKQMAAEATSQSVGLQFTATAQVIGATATANQLLVEAQQTERARLDAIATADQARLDAQSTQMRLDVIATDVQGRKDIQATQSYLSTSTFTAMTLTAIPPHATSTQIAVNNQIALAAKDLERSELSLQQQRDTNTIQWLIPTVIAIGLSLVGVFYIYNQSRIREIRDEDGKFQVFILDNKTATKPALWTGPVLDLKTSSMPLLADPREQADVTRRAQAIEALAAMPVQPTASGAGAFNDAFSVPQKREDAFEIIENDALPAELLDSETLKVLDKDWKESSHER